VSRLKELLFLLISDLIFISVAYSVYYYFRIETGLIKYTNPVSYLIPMLVINIYWLIVFSFFGLYQHWFVRSRFDEFSSVFKTVLVGCLFLFFAIFIDDYMKDAAIISRFLILILILAEIICLYYSGSRSAWIALAAEIWLLVVILLVIKRKKKSLLAVIISSFIFISIFIEPSSKINLR